MERKDKLMKKIIFVISIFFLFLINVEAGEYKQNDKEALKLALDFEKLLFTAAPNSKDFISFIDISTIDGHLVIWVKEKIFSLEKNSQNAVYGSIIKLWRGTKYVRNKNYGNWAEIKFNDYMKGKIGTIKTIK